MSMIEINGKTYEPAKIDFNAMCQMEEFGVSIFDSDSKGLSALRAYFALTSGMTLTEAGAEIGQHLSKGGSLEDLNDAFSKAVKDAIFFLTAQRNATENPEA